MSSVLEAHALCIGQGCMEQPGPRKTAKHLCVKTVLGKTYTWCSCGDPACDAEATERHPLTPARSNLAFGKKGPP